MLYQVLPRLLLLQRAIPSSSWRGIPLLVRASELPGAGSGTEFAPFIDKFLKAVSAGEVVQHYQPEAQYRIKTLYTIEWGSAAGDTSPGQDFNAPASALRLTRDALYRARGIRLERAIEEPPVLVYVTRNLTASRKVENEAALLARLAQTLHPTPKIEVWHGTEEPLTAVDVFAGARYVLL